jgi:hypothetical protein
MPDSRANRVETEQFQPRKIEKKSSLNLMRKSVWIATDSKQVAPGGSGTKDLPLAERPTTPLMTPPNTDLGLSIRVSMFEYVRLVTGTSSFLVKNRVEPAQPDFFLGKHRSEFVSKRRNGPFVTWKTRLKRPICAQIG